MCPVPDAADLPAWVDEAGHRGLLREFKPEQDGRISLIRPIFGHRDHA
jgi:hypothetical protein